MDKNLSGFGPCPALRLSFGHVSGVLKNPAVSASTTQGTDARWKTVCLQSPFFLRV